MKGRRRRTRGHGNKAKERYGSKRRTGMRTREKGKREEEKKTNSKSHRKRENHKR